MDELQKVVRAFDIVDHHKLKGVAQAIAALPTSSPTCTAYCWSADMSSRIENVVESGEVDVLHVEHLRAAHFRPKHRRVPVVLDAVDCLTTLFKQMAAAKDAGAVKRLVMAEEAWKLRKYEPKTLARFDHVLATTHTERDALLALDQALNVSVIPNGVDTDYFHPFPGQHRPNRIIFTGKMSYAPNAQAAVWFARNVLPLVQSNHPEAELVIAGSNPPREVTELATLPNVRVTGFVQDMRSEMAGSAVAVAPMLIAVGIQNKILEAMAMGLPVVTNTMAAKAFGGDCPGILVADSAEEMAGAVSSLLAQPGRARAMGDEGIKRIHEHYSWASSAAQLEKIYRQLLSAS